MKVLVADILDAIALFNREGRNPYGELVPIKGHAPLLFELRTGQPPRTKARFPEYPRLEVPFFAADRNKEDDTEARTACFETDREFLFPMTKAYIKGGWHRVYKYNVAARTVQEVRLLVRPAQDRSYTGRSAHEWLEAEEKRGLIFKSGFEFEERRGLAAQRS